MVDGNRRPKMIGYGLNTRHTSPQNPGFFIYTAFNIVGGNVHYIESELLRHLDSIQGSKRQIHFSTGSKSECFFINPNEMTYLVESFIENNFQSCVTYNSLVEQISRYQCDDDVYRKFEPEPTPWGISPAPPPSNLALSRSKYFPDNQIEYEADLGDGHFLDYETGMQGYRDEDGNEEWKEWK